MADFADFGRFRDHFGTVLRPEMETNLGCRWGRFRPHLRADEGVRGGRFRPDLGAEEGSEDVDFASEMWRSGLFRWGWELGVWRFSRKNKGWDRKNRDRERESGNQGSEKQGAKKREQGQRTETENREQGLLPLVYEHSASFPVSPSDLTHNYRIIRESCTSVPPIKTPSFILLIHYKPYHNPLA